MTIHFADGLILAASIALSIPFWMLSLECLAALLLPPRGTEPSQSARGHVDVLIPAHDESAGISATLASVQQQLGPKDRVWVVADNCSDDTASIARSHGSIVLERTDSQHRGKSYALDFGLCHVALDPREVLVILDADCQLEPGCLDELAATCLSTGRPVQASYLMHVPNDPAPSDVVSQYAVTLKNLIRPLGLRRLGFSSPLTGSGMGFPWKALRSRDLASGCIVEDMQLGISLLLDGCRPLFCPTARVAALLPSQETASIAQRRRWEHGHLHLILTQVPRLLLAACLQLRIDLLVAALDVGIPPLSLLAMGGLGTMLAAIAVGLHHAAWIPAAVIGTAGAVSLGSVFLACWRFSSDVPRWRALRGAPRYVARKLPMYLSFLLQRQKDWIRTARASSTS